MVVVKWVLIVLLAAVVAAVLAGQLGWLRGSAPALGVRDGRLRPPSNTPNSVSSQALLHPDHPRRTEADIAPLALRGDGEATLAKIEAIVAAMDGAQLQKREAGYLYATYTTRLMKYVDDVEFWFDPAKQVVQVRSASRVGRKDFGVNRARIEAIRAKLAAA